MDTLKAQRRALRKQAKRTAKNTRRQATRRAIKCFWTWPLGHEWVNLGTDEDPCHRCISCDTPRSLHEQQHRTVGDLLGDHS